MTLTPKLSICVPSRNRQKYFKQTIAALLRSLRLDVEFVFADNSDDPSIMNDYMVEVARDPRVVYLPSTGQTLPMVDNWERTMAASTGAWIVFMGDDDYIDPAVAQLITNVEAGVPYVDGICWGVVHYHWPHSDRPISNVFVPYKHTAMRIPRSIALQRFFGWQDAVTVPTSGFSIYHSAISRRLMEKIRTDYCGDRYFEHPVVDYDSAMKVLCSGENFVFCQRPFGIMGVCPESNSFAIGRLDDMKKKMDAFTKDSGRDIDEDDGTKGFPFRAAIGLTACIGHVQQWFKHKYKLQFSGWEKNFAKACARNVEIFTDPEAFELVERTYRSAFERWEGGRHLQHFQPKMSEDRIPILATGSMEDGLYIDRDIAGVATPAEIYDIIDDMCVPVEAIEIDLRNLEVMGQPPKKQSARGKR